MDDSKTRLTLTDELRGEMNELAVMAVKELAVFLGGSEIKSNDRTRVAMNALSSYAKLHQSENGAQRIMITALTYCNVQNPAERRKYIAQSMPQLNLID